MNELIAAVERLLGRGIVVEPFSDGSYRVRLADDPSDDWPPDELIDFSDGEKGLTW